MSLTKRLCHEQNPQSELLVTKYFTANINAKLESSGEASCKNQQNYLLALDAHNKNAGNSLEIIRGQYHIRSKELYANNDPVDFGVKHQVLLPEEKQTDVAIATSMVIDSMKEHCDQVVLISNDSDLTPALRSIRDYCPRINIGVVAPNRESNRYPSAMLDAYSDWTRKTIKDEELFKSQLPDNVLTRKRKIIKPDHW